MTLATANGIDRREPGEPVGLLLDALMASPSAVPSARRPDCQLGLHHIDITIRHSVTLTTWWNGTALTY
jgi:hypothetical protein